VYDIVKELLSTLPKHDDEGNVLQYILTCDSGFGSPELAIELDKDPNLAFIFAMKFNSDFGPYFQLM